MFSRVLLRKRNVYIIYMIDKMRRGNEKFVPESQSSKRLETDSRASDLTSAMSRTDLENQNQFIYRPLRSSLLVKVSKKVC